MTQAIEIQNLSKTFFSPFNVLSPWKPRRLIHALQNVSLQIPSGTIYVLLGPNGAGKTTLLKSIATLVRPESGSISIEGHSIDINPDAARASISYTLNHEHSFYRRLTARQNLEFFSAFYNLPRHDAQERVQALAEEFGMTAILDRRYEELSTGMRQRVALTRSFLSNPSVYLIDEPTKSLDPQAQEECLQWIQALARSRQKTVLMTTHQIEHAEVIANRVGIIDHGKLVFEGEAQGIRENYKRYVD